jgi:hypothetical protein
MSNRSNQRGHRPRIGGKDSKGSIQKTVRLPIETLRKFQKEIGKRPGAFSKYVRILIDGYLETVRITKHK